MVGEVRLGAMAAVAMVAVLASLGVVDALDRFGAWPVLPALFPLVPLIIAAAVALAMRSLDFSDIVRGGNIGSASTGWALGGMALSTVVLVASPVGTALGGVRGLILIAAFVAGLALASFVVTPAMRSMRATTLAEAIGARFGPPARAIASVAVILTLLPLLAAEARLAGTVAARMLGLEPRLAEGLVLGLVLIVCIVGGLRAAIALAAVLGPVVAIAYLLPVAAAMMGETWLPLPWSGLFDPEAFATATRIPNIVILAFTVSLVAGIAVMPTLLFPAWSTAEKPPSGRHVLWGVAFAALVLLAAPSYAIYGRLAGIDAASDPLGLVVNFPEQVGLSAMPALLLIGGLFSAALIAITMALATAAATLGHDLYGGLVERRAPAGRRIFIARLGMILLVFGILAVHRAEFGSVAMMAGVSLSIAAASLAPVVLVGWRLPGTSPAAAFAAIAVGLWLTVANVVLARFAPEFSSTYLGMAAVTPTVLGPTGWFGLPVGLSGLLGLCCGLATLLAVSILPSVSWPLLWLRLRHAARKLRRKLASRTRPRIPPGAATAAGPPPPTARADEAPLVPAELVATAEPGPAPVSPAAAIPMFGPFPEIAGPTTPGSAKPIRRLPGV